MTQSVWDQATGPRLAQGDLLPDCLVPAVLSNFDPAAGTTGASTSAVVEGYDLIVMTQSCDLENGKAASVACCPVFGIVEYEKTAPAFARVGEWERVRQGRVEGLHLLPSPTAPDDKWAASVVDFRSIFSLPVVYLTAHAGRLPARWRLRPPYLEHFSQAFARFFMRVGLPTNLPSYAVPPKRPGGLV